LVVRVGLRKEEERDNKELYKNRPKIAVIKKMIIFTIRAENNNTNKFHAIMIFYSEFKPCHLVLCLVRQKTGA
jgi:hypothetical protein